MEQHVFSKMLIFKNNSEKSREYDLYYNTNGSLMRSNHKLLFVVPPRYSAVGDGALREYTHTLRLVCKPPDLRVGCAHSCTWL